MMYGGCKCFHHKFAMFLNLLGFVAAVLFFWSALSGNMIWGLDDTFYFEAVVVLAIAAHGTKFCRCCWKHGMGMLKSNGTMLGAPYCDHDKGMCKHPEGCKCGGCDACK